MRTVDNGYEYSRNVRSFYRTYYEYINALFVVPVCSTRMIRIHSDSSLFDTINTSTYYSLQS